MSLSASLTNVGHPVAYYPRLARFFGSVNVAILFAQLHYWSQRGESDLGTHKSSEQFTEETGLSYREQVTARKQLRDAEAAQLKDLETTKGIVVARPDLGPWKAAMGPAWDKVKARVGADNFKRFMDMVE